MKRIAALCLVTFAALAGTARAQFAVPAQRPQVEPAGTLILYPTIGVVHDGDLDFTDVALMIRGRYSVLDQMSVSAQLGGAFGDADEFQFGFGTKFQVLEQSNQMPVLLSVFGALDIGIGDIDSESLAFGPLVGHRFESGNLGLTPYAGFSVGFTHASFDAANANADDSSTDAIFGFVLGGDIAFNRDVSVGTEFTIGATDGIPVLNWHMGINYALLSAPKYVPPPARNY